MRWLSLILAAAAAAAAARIVRKRRAASHAPTPPAPPAPPAAAPEPDVAPQQDVTPEPEATTRSAVSPAATTVSQTQDDLLAGLREEVPDHQVEREVEAQLDASPLPAEEVSVEVRDHVAQLEGTVPDPQTAMLLGDEAAHVDGVKGLDNRLRPERETVDEDPGAPRDAEAARDPGESEREA
jgi:hypothetical protein